ncbi:MAG: Arabinose efflux permease family protein [Desulfotomaculum sp. 46_80]|nr:MAG: Arabinose efflux permease family protein [Desulfotomaculum sp. 46_80]
MMIAFILTALFVKESFTRQDKRASGIKETWKSVPEKSLTIILFVTFFALTLGLSSIEPIVTIYVAHLTKGIGHVALLSGLTFSASGLASIIAAPRLGRLSDQIGAHKIMLAALVAAGIIYIPQALVTNPWQLMGLRFLLGLTIAGLNPSINTLVKKITPDSLTGRVFGFNMSAGYLGIFGGAVLGGQVAAYFDVR